MALPTASDNIFPKLILDEGGTLGTVTAGERRLGIDANGVLVWKNSAGTTSPLVALNKWDATVAPSVNDDSGDGYQVGSRWIDVTNNKEYVCLDASVGAAVWTETTQSAGGVATSSARVYNNGTQAIPDATTTALLFGAEENDPDGWHSTSSATDRLVWPAGVGAGTCDLRAHTMAAADPDAERILFLRKNGADIIGGAMSQYGYAALAGSPTARLQVVVLGLPGAPGDYFQAMVYSPHGGGVNLNYGGATGGGEGAISTFEVRAFPN